MEINFSKIFLRFGLVAIVIVVVVVVVVDDVVDVLVK